MVSISESVRLDYRTRLGELKNSCRVALAFRRIHNVLQLRSTRKPFWIV